MFKTFRKIPFFVCKFCCLKNIMLKKTQNAIRTCKSKTLSRQCPKVKVLNVGLDQQSMLTFWPTSNRSIYQKCFEASYFFVTPFETCRVEQALTCLPSFVQISRPLVRKRQNNILWIGLIYIVVFCSSYHVWQSHVVDLNWLPMPELTLP